MYSLTFSNWILGIQPLAELLTDTSHVKPSKPFLVVYLFFAICDYVIWRINVMLLISSTVNIWKLKPIFSFRTAAIFFISSIFSRVTVHCHFSFDYQCHEKLVLQWNSLFTDEKVFASFSHFGNINNKPIWQVTYWIITAT